MAKIYETKEDYAKDVLKDQAKDLHLKSEKQAGWGSSLILLNFFVDLLHARGARVSSLVQTVAGALGFVGIFKFVQSWMTGGKARDLEMQRERLGPEIAILPPDITPANTPEKECAPCKMKRYAAALGPTSLMDQAVKGEDGMEQGR